MLMNFIFHIIIKYLNILCLITKKDRVPIFKSGGEGGRDSGEKGFQELL